MLFKNKNFILIIFVAALGLIAWGVVRDNSFQADVPELKSLFSDSVDKIEIQGGGSSHVLVKEGDEWKVKEGEVAFPADSEAVKAVVEGLKNFEVAEIVSQNGEKYSTFGVDETSALQIVLYEKDTGTRRLYVGNTDYRSGGDYVRVGEQVPVYITDTSIRSSFLKDTYKDLRLSDVETEAVNEVAFAYADSEKSFTVVKKMIPQDKDTKSSAGGTQEWFYKDDTELKEQLDGNAVSAILSAVKNHAARNILPVDKAKDYGFEKSSIVITMTDAQGVEQIFFGNQTEDKSAYYASVSGKDGWIYEVESSFVESVLSKGKEGFLKKEEPKE